MSMIGASLVDRYRLVAELGQGGMGVVYLADDPVLERQVAVKMLPPGFMTDESVERLRREAKVVAKMDHPAITPVFDLGHHHESLFLVMPVLHGETLRGLLDGGKLSIGDALRVTEQVADALDYAHSHGVIHRDVKPENIMVLRERGTVRARVMDFGLAHDPSARQSLTRRGGILGTVTYMSPEQIQGATLDPRSDLYSLGVVLYECLAGRPPFVGPVHRLIVSIAQDTPVPLVEEAEVDAELSRLVDRCLAKDPSGRPESGREVAARLQACVARFDGEVLAQSIIVPTSAALPTRWPSLVGRRAEIARLEERLAAAMAGEAQWVVIDGDVGIGKSRLLQELGRLAEERGVRVLCGRVADRRNAPPYQAFCELVQDYFRARDQGVSGFGETADLTDLAPDLVAHFPIFSELDELRAEPVPRTTVDDPTALRELLARTLRRLAGGRPLVILLENLHEGDATVDALAYVARRLGATPTLFAATVRSSEIDAEHPVARLYSGFADDPRLLHLTLGPLDAESMAELLRDQLSAGTSSGELTGDLVERLHATSEGNPLFALELVQSLRDSDDLRQSGDGSWVLDPASGSASGSLPGTIRQAVERHLERLGDAPRRLLEVAAVLGRHFDADDLEVVAADVDPQWTLDAIDRALDQLIQEGFLAEERRGRGSDPYAFVSGLVRDVLDHGLARRRRRRLHRIAADQLQARHGEAGSILPRLLHHATEGDLADDAIRYGLALARRAEATAAWEEVGRAAGSALRFLPEPSDVGAETASTVGELLALLSRSERAAGCL
ncbi:MAG: protein kinase, partial [Acidobacteriota bacterium]